MRHDDDDINVLYSLNDQFHSQIYIWFLVLAQPVIIIG